MGGGVVGRKESPLNVFTRWICLEQYYSTLLYSTACIWIMHSTHLVLSQHIHVFIVHAHEAGLGFTDYLASAHQQRAMIHLAGNFSRQNPNYMYLVNISDPHTPSVKNKKQKTIRTQHKKRSHAYTHHSYRRASLRTLISTHTHESIPHLQSRAPERISNTQFPSPLLELPHDRLQVAHALVENVDLVLVLVDIGILQAAVS